MCFKGASKRRKQLCFRGWLTKPGKGAPVTRIPRSRAHKSIQDQPKTTQKHPKTNRNPFEISHKTTTPQENQQQENKRDKKKRDYGDPGEINIYIYIS